MPAMRAGALLFIALSLSVLVASCGGPSARISTPARVAPHEIASNVLRADYAGSAACAKCHADIAQRWLSSPMHNMTRTYAPGISRAPFSGTALRLKDDRVDLEERASGERIVHVHSARFGDADYRVTRVIGGHHREDYAGVQVGNENGEELVLPISWLTWSKKFRYKGYSVMSHERPGLIAGPAWNRTCIFCHNTEPYFRTCSVGSWRSIATPVAELKTDTRRIKASSSTRSCRQVPSGASRSMTSARSTRSSRTKSSISRARGRAVRRPSSSGARSQRREKNSARRI